ncbi:hypothetical protein CKO44_16050 [Rubrivivax gelatinosus]|uniref:hypothetical protein n=1 Tax=Rubrivivax gelatinosus TaxID=28068 RepID=UPI0019061150|nr:hypothetical protein [Rubrivivax gelatinosus]MBK1614982.1 hypothetical protein [Rubrivivax gelatinosus]
MGGQLLTLPRRPGAVTRQRLVEAVRAAPMGIALSDLARQVGVCEYTAQRHLAMVDRAAAGIALVGRSWTSRWCAAERAADVTAAIGAGRFPHRSTSARALQRQADVERRKAERAGAADVPVQRIVAAAAAQSLRVTGPRSVFDLGGA